MNRANLTLNFEMIGGVGFRAVTLVLLVSCCVGSEVQSAESLKTLVDQYAAIPTSSDELMLEHHLNNPLLENPMGGFGNAERNIIHKQFLLANIYRQALLEVRGPDSATDLRMLFLAGVPPGGSSRSLSTIERLSNARVFFEVIEGLVHRESTVGLVALELLEMQGIRYPSTDSWARGLARFAALSATDSMLFSRVLEVYENLYRLSRHYATPERPFRSVGSIAGEIASPVYNPAIAEPGLRKKIVTNLLREIDRRQGDLRAELITGLTQIEGDPRVRPFIVSLLRRSTDARDLKAVMQGVSAAGSDHSLILFIASQLNRYIEVPLEGPKVKSVFSEAMSTITSPFWLRQDDKARPLKPLMLKLLRHSKSQVRQHAIVVLRSGVFSIDEATRITKTLLSDPAETVRLKAIDSFWSVSAKFEGNSLLSDLARISEQDPSPQARKYAALAPEQVRKSNSRQCQLLFVSPRASTTK